ncbi:MAG: hypothetical protein QM753_08710 [Thermomicrobiales bacterium]
MSVGEGEHNAQGLGYLRRRYVRRAEHLVSSRKNPEFLHALEEFREAWGLQYPKYSIIRGGLLDDAPPPCRQWPERSWYRLYHPGTLDSDFDRMGKSPSGEPPYSDVELREFFLPGEAILAWDSAVKDLAQRFWPPRDYAQPFGAGHHPALTFVSACMMFDARIGDVERFFPAFTLELQSLPYSPERYPEPVTNARLLGQLFYLRDQLRSLVGPETFNEYSLRALEYGDQLAHQRFPEGPVPSADSDSWFWYVPVVPGMASGDLRDIQSTVVDLSKSLPGGDQLARRVKTLRAEGLSQEAVANLLGITVDMVRRFRSPA